MQASLNEALQRVGSMWEAGAFKKRLMGNCTHAAVTQRRIGMP